MKNKRFTAFETYLQSKNISKSTIKSYINQVIRFNEWFALQHKKAIATTTKKDILNYLQYLEKKALANSTRQSILGILNHYFNHLFQGEQIAINPTLLLKIRGTKRTILKSILTIDELETLLDNYYHIYPNDKSQYLQLTICIYQGITPSECTAITNDNINLHKGTITIDGTRKSNTRTMPLHASQIGQLYAYTQNMSHDNIKLFTSKIQTNKIKKIYPQFTDFKQIRASIITHWIKTEGLRKAQYKAGHRYISSTENYLSNDLESLKDDISKFHPL
jgi:integrase/recombinase XerD